ncbi:hypothetical protein RB25_01160 [Herbaspirillum rubrisubalbicans]|uniref:Uncharacterized protein n=1 Tax=Herbaspirillum rubrisubalbicans TaxID=80842 RepID=A0ABX9C6E0_9BURK|nr:hypothetical protein RB24_04080 [Herbaspirillum rubrisubalbicans]RAN50397.1 hypothetical protein RB25_01160 [Herbaspirillum rubrisubalbicans]
MGVISRPIWAGAALKTGATPFISIRDGKPISSKAAVPCMSTTTTTGAAIAASGPAAGIGTAVSTILATTMARPIPTRLTSE